MNIVLSQVQGKEIARSQAGERTECVLPAGPTAAEESPFKERHPVSYLSQAINFLGVEEGCQVKRHEHQSP